MENKQLIKKYALSLYEVGKKEDALDDIQKGIEALNSLYKSSSTFRYLLLTKKIAENDKPLKKLDPPKPKKESTEPDNNQPVDLNTFNIDPELRETLHILSDFYFILVPSLRRSFCPGL